VSEDERKSDSFSDGDPDSDGEAHDVLLSDISFGNQRVFTKFAKELAITSDNPQYLFQSLSQICVTLSSGGPSHAIAFDSPLLACERVESFLKLLGFVADHDASAYVLSQIDAQCINHARVACREQLEEIAKKSSTIHKIVTNRRRNGSISFSHSATSRLRPSIALSPPPPPHDEDGHGPNGDVDGTNVTSPSAAGTVIGPPDIDDDQCQLYELIWSITHPISTDHKAKDVMLLCYMMITSSLKFLKLLEARFFNEDNGRASCSSEASEDGIGNGPSPSPNPGSIPSVVSLPPLKLTMGSVSNTSQISLNFDHDRIKSSYGVQKKVVHMIRIWMQKYWDEDWHCAASMVSYVEDFVRRATRAYANDDEFDDDERNKGLELIGSIHKTVQRQRAEMKFHSTELSLTSLSRILVPSLHSELQSEALKGGGVELKHSRIHSEMVPRTRSKSDNKEDGSEHNKLKANTSSKPRRKSLHKRKISTMFTSSPLQKPRTLSRTLSRTSLSGAVANDLLKVNNKSLSGQLALFLFSKYTAIKPRECLYQYSVRKKPTSPSGADQPRRAPLDTFPNIKVYKETFNHIVKWVQSSILLQQQVGKRARIIKKWIKVADELFNLRCFQGFVAVQCALASNAIYSLKEAWNQHSVLKRKHHTKYKEIKVIMSASHNFENLRRLQREAHPPLIPYFGVFCKDLISIQEGMCKRNKDGLINWNKLWRIYELIKEHLQYQSTPYTELVEEDQPLQEWLRTELTRAGTLKSELLDKMSRDVAQNDKMKTGRHQKSFTMIQ